MNKIGAWVIPPSVCSWVKKVPKDAPVALLLRHSVRDDDRLDFAAPITPDGVNLAIKLGALLKDSLQSVHTSPFVRCVQTAKALIEGSGNDLEIQPDRLLGDPGIYVLTSEKGGMNWNLLGHEKVMENLVMSDDALPGMAVPDAAARYLTHHMLAETQGKPGLHVFITHDSLITATAARMLCQPLGPESWPWYLEGAFFWKREGEYHVSYREWHHNFGRGPLCKLDEMDVTEMARREIAATVGLDCPARFFLAGGAFKSLLTGRPPRDLDLWAPSEKDRGQLIATLRRRGAEPLRSTPFADVFKQNERKVEIPKKTEPSSLEERLARFDIALSAIGVEHKPGDQWRAVVHPAAKKSAERREILLIKPLVNWKYALATLERMRRYADELGFEIPTSEIDTVWRTFESQTKEMRLGMIERYDKSGFGEYDVRRDALWRL